MKKNELNRARYIENVSSKSFSLPSPTVTFGRVQSVELDERSSFGVITYGAIDKNTENTDATTYPRAYPLKSSLKHYPVVGEIVMLFQAPAFEAAINNSKTQKRTYYSDIVSIWNEINHNAWIDTDQDGEVNLDEKNKFNDIPNFEEDEDIQPLKPGQGDVIFQGRQGQSILFSNKVTNQIESNRDGSLKDPILILANGQFKSGPQDWHELDINKDPSSIYFLSNHSINITSDYINKHTSLLNSNQYNGNQLVINSNRLVFNSKKDENVEGSGEILFNLGGSTSIQSGENLELLTDKQTLIDSAKIYIGEKSIKEDDPIVLGNKLIDAIEIILKTLDGIGDACLSAANAGGPVPTLVAEGGFIKEAVLKLRNVELPKILSKKTFIE